MSVSYNPSSVTSSLVLCLDAANPKSYPGSGTTWTDLTSNRFVATLRNSPTLSSGAFSFTAASTQYADIPYSATLSPTSAVSVECWAYSSSWSGLSASTRLVSKTEAGGWQISANEGTYIAAGYIGFVCQLGGTYYGASTLLSGLAAGWHQFTGTCDGRNVRFFVDGFLVATTTAPANAAITYSNNNNIIIAGEAGASSPNSVVGGTYFTGSISNVKIYNKTLADSEITQNFNALRGRYGI